MEKEDILILMELLIMMAIIKMTILMVMVFINSQMETDMMDISKMINIMDMEF